MTTRYAITGATGCLGRALINRLERQGRIRALVRTPSGFTEALRLRGHEMVPGDLDDREALDRLVSGVDVVFHCAARLGNADEAASERVNVHGTRLLAEACARARVKRFVYVSSISVFSATGHDQIEEGDMPRNLDRLCAYSRTKLKGEFAVREVARRTGLKFTIVRPTNVYGPWSAPWVMNWVRLLERIPIRFGNVPIDVVHVDDVAEGLALAAESPAGVNEVFHIGNEQVLMRDFLRRIGDAIGRPTRRLPNAIDWAVRAIAHHGFRLRTGRTLGLPLLDPPSFSHAKASHMLGYSPSVSLTDGFTELRRWYRQEVVERGGQARVA
jgi:nucleoside-diphosphate-sugar epimerase